MTSSSTIQIGNADGIETFAHDEGEVVSIRDDVAAMFIEQGVAVEVRTSSSEVSTPPSETASVPSKRTRARKAPSK